MSWLFRKRTLHLPEATGSFVPGCADVMLDYKKEGVFMRLYYPSDLQKGRVKNAEHWLPWVPDGLYIDGIAEVLLSFKFLIRVAFWWSAGLIPVAYGSKPKLDRKLKCIVLSHGLGGQRSFYSNICCELASRGYLVAALEHRDGSACYTYYYESDENARNNIRTDVKYEPFQLGKKHHPQRKRQVAYRAQECCRVVDFLKDLNDGTIPHNVIDDVPSKRPSQFWLQDLVGNLDLETITMMGHSFGGATALLTLSQRQDLKQGILLDPWMYPIKDGDLHTKVTQPLIFVNTQTFHIVSNVQAMAPFSAITENVMYTILHTTHEHQTDTALLVGSWLNWFMKKLDPLMALCINNALILKFLDDKVGSPSSIDDSTKCLELQRSNFIEGLTKPWA